MTVINIRAEVSFQWKNPDFLLKSDEFIMKQNATLRVPASLCASSTCLRDEYHLSAGVAATLPSELLAALPGYKIFRNCSNLAPGEALPDHYVIGDTTQNANGYHVSFLVRPATTFTTRPFTNRFSSHAHYAH